MINGKIDRKIDGRIDGRINGKIVVSLDARWPQIEVTERGGACIRPRRDSHAIAFSFGPLPILFPAEESQ
jgi:hypothetical protein